MPSRAESLVIGISGGIDSSVTSTICALTGKKTIILSMPIKQIKEQVRVTILEMRREFAVAMIEQTMKLEQAVQAGQMIPERKALELEKLKKQQQEQLINTERQMISDLQKKSSVIENKVITKKEFDIKKNGLTKKEFFLMDTL